MKKSTVVVVSVAALSLSLTGCAGGSQSPGADDGADQASAETITFSTGTQFPPMGYVEDDELIGFDIDLGEELGKRAGVEIVWAESEFSQFLSDVNSGRTDGILGAMLDTPERQEHLSWIDYLESGFQFFTTKEVAEEHSIGDVPDLCGLTVAASRNSTYAGAITEWSTENCNGDDIAVLDTDGSPDALLQLRQGRAQAVMQTSEAIAYMVSNDEQLMTVGEPITTSFYGLGFSNDDEETQGRFVEALEEIIADGTYEQIAADWGLEAQVVDRVTVNLEGR